MATTKDEAEKLVETVKFELYEDEPAARRMAEGVEQLARDYDRARPANNLKRRSQMAKRKLLQPRKVMREELAPTVSQWPFIEDAAGVPRGTVKKFVEDDEISDEHLAKLDDLNRK